MNGGIIDTIYFLTLGDGDFSFSLDLAQYLSSSETNNIGTNHVVLSATGVDSLDEVRIKYHDFEFISSKLNALSKSSFARKNDIGNNRTISISLHHNINAIISDDGENFDNSLPKHQFQHVIFNHPHIGTENATLHNRFLSHFFYSCYNYWLKPGGVLHLTLVKQQCERWFCLESADKQGFVLLNRLDFIPPPTNRSPGEKDTAVSYYQHRRHQSGKSFASRTEGSEVLTFGKKIDQNNFTAKFLPWYETIDVNGATKTSKNEKRKMQLDLELETPLAKPFQCIHCSKKFREERSLKNHVQNLHKTKSSNEDIISCDICVPPRIFKSKEALNDHKLSKHSGKFTDIKPDWCASKMNESCNVEKSNVTQNFGCCPICLQSYNSIKEKDNHLLQFIPSADIKETWECKICSKKFREERALLQHSNYCSFRRSLNVDS